MKARPLFTTALVLSAALSGDAQMRGAQAGMADVSTRCADGVADEALGGPCLTALKLAALRKLYAGSVNPRTGEQIYSPLTFGSEDQALGSSSQGDPETWPAQQFYPFRWAFGAGFDPKSFDFDHDLDWLDALLAPPLNANGLDLADFRRRGGKTILYTGLADPAVPVQEVAN